MLYFSLVVVFYFVLKVLCCNIYYVFVDSSSKGETAVESVRQGCLVIKFGLQLLKKLYSFFKFSYFVIP